MGFQSYEKYHDTWIDRTLSTLSLTQLNQLVLRSMRAAQDEEVDLFSRRGVLDPRMLPFLGGLFSHEHDVGGEEAVTLVEGATGLDLDEKSLVTQMGVGIFTDPLAWTTLGVGSAGRAAQTMRSAQKTLGSKAVDAKTAGEFLEETGKISFLKTLDKSKRKKILRDRRKMEKIIEKEAAKKGGLNLKDMGTMELNSYLEADVFRLGVPLFASKVGINIPAMREGMTQWMTKPIRGSAKGLIGAPAKLLRGTALALREAGDTWSAELTHRMAAIAATPVDFFAGTKGFASEFKDFTGTMLDHIGRNMPEDMVRRLASADTGKALNTVYYWLRENLPHTATPEETNRIARQFTLSLQEAAEGTDVLTAIRELRQGRRSFNVSTLQEKLPDYLKGISNDVINGTKAEKWAATYRALTSNFGAKSAATLRKAFQGRTASATINKVLNDRSAMYMAHSRYVHAHGEAIGNRLERLNQLKGIEDGDSTLRYWRTIFDVTPGVGDEMIFGATLSDLSSNHLSAKIDAVSAFQKRLDNMISMLDGQKPSASGTVDPKRLAGQKVFEGMFPEGYKPSVSNVERLRKAQNQFGKSGEELLNVRKELESLQARQAKVHKGGSPEEIALLDQQVAVAQQVQEAATVRLQAVQDEAMDAMLSARTELQRRAVASWRTEGSWVVDGLYAGGPNGPKLDKLTFATEAEARAAAKEAGIPLRDKKGRYANRVRTEGEDIARELFDRTADIQARNTELAENFGFIGKGQVSTIAYTPRVLDANELEEFDAIIGRSKDFKEEVDNIIASSGAHARGDEFRHLTTDELNTVLKELSAKEGYQGITDDLKALLDRTRTRYAADPFTPLLTRSSQYGGYVTGANIIDDVLEATGDDFMGALSGLIPASKATPVAGGKLVDIEPIGKVGVPAADGSKGVHAFEAIFETAEGKRFRVPIHQASQEGMRVQVVLNPKAKEAFKGRGDTLGESYMYALANGGKQATVDLGEMASQSPKQMWELINAIKEGDIPYAMVGQQKTLSAVHDAAGRQLKASFQMPAIVDGAHRVLKMGVTTGNGSFHAATVASAAPMALMNGMNPVAFTRGLMSATAMIWKTPRMDLAARQYASASGHAITGNQPVGFVNLTSGLFGAGQGLKGKLTSPAAMVGAGIGYDQLTEDTRFEAGEALAGLKLGVAGGAIQFFRRGAGQNLIRSANLSSFDPRHYGDDFTEDAVAFIGMDGAKYSQRELLGTAAKYGLFNTFAGEGTQQLSRSSKELKALILNDKNDLTKLMDALGDAGQQSEIFSRLAVFHGFLHMGLDPAAAAKRTVSTLFDYNQITPLEQTALKRLNSFYIFGKKITEQTYQNYTKDPGKLAVLSHLAYGREREGAEVFGEKVDIDTSTGRAEVVWGDKSVDLNRLIPQLDLFHGIAYGRELFDSLYRGVTPAAFDQAAESGGLKSRVASEEVAEALRMGRLSVAPDLAAAMPGILGGNILFDLDPQDMQSGLFHIAGTLNSNVIGNTMLLKNILDLLPASKGTDAEVNRNTTYDDFIDSTLNLVTVKGRDRLVSRKEFFDSRYQKTLLGLKRALNEAGRTDEDKQAILDLIRRTEARYAKTFAGRRQDLTSFTPLDF